MVKDYSAFLGAAAGPSGAQKETSQLESWGWGPLFAQQSDVAELQATPPVRIVAVHRSGMQVIGNGIERSAPPMAEATVGDWLLLDPERPGGSRILARNSLIKRRAPGSDRQVQLIAANVDTVFVVTSCNQDFNIARLERYVALALDAGVEPVIVLTKVDLVDDPSDWVEAAASISDRVSVVAVDARRGDPVTALAEWCEIGRTVAFLGSSGVGKSTLTNALAGSDGIATQAIREDDARGRHTTTHRELHLTPQGCLVLDTPGMRELQLTDAAAGIAELFEDIEELTTQCQFNDCQHETEPNCAIQSAITDGTLEKSRLERWRKLRAEDTFNSSTLAERRGKDRAFGKMVRNAMREKSARR